MAVLCARLDHSAHDEYTKRIEHALYYLSQQRQETNAYLKFPQDAAMFTDNPSKTHTAVAQWLTQIELNPNPIQEEK